MKKVCSFHDGRKKKAFKIITICFISILLFIPYFWHPFLLNQHEDISNQLMDILRLTDTTLDFEFTKTTLYANFFVQLIRESHGFFRLLLLFPVFRSIDIFGINLTEASVMSTYLIVGFSILLFCFFVLKRIIGKSMALLVYFLLSTTPYFIMQIKAGWTFVYFLLPFFSGLYSLHSFLITKNSRWWSLFCLSSVLVIFSNPGFIFGGLFYFLYILTSMIDIKNLHTSGKEVLRLLFVNRWSYFIWLTLTFEGLLAILGKNIFGGDYGVIGKILLKSTAPPSYGIKTIVSFLSEGVGLLGFILWPLILISAISLFFQWKLLTSNRLLLTCFLSFWITFLLLIFIGMGSGAYIYELLIPGLLMCVLSVRQMFQKTYFMVIFFFVILSGYLQTLGYNFHYYPKNFLTDDHFFIQRDNGIKGACTTLWCPYHFEPHVNIGMKTVGFVLRDLEISPVSYTDWHENFIIKPKEIFVLAENNNQAPSFHIGRRFNHKIEFLNEAKFIIILDEQFYQTREQKERYKQVIEFVHLRQFPLLAKVTSHEKPVSFIYAKNWGETTREFPIEVYDKKFDNKYGNIKSLGHIDLQS